MIRRDVWIWSITVPLLLAIAGWLVWVHAAAPHATGREVALISTGADAPAVGDPSSAPQSPTARDPAAAGRPVVAGGWVSTVAGRTGIPDRALSAYADAQLTLATTRPRCHLTWTMLAGIGAIESGHGSFGGATLRPDGTTTVRILGPALDGTHGNIAVRATAEGLRIDGDARWDHAVGPMQFTPSTWAHWGVSADGGVPDPNNIDDAALTAGEYLCAAGGDLWTPAGWNRAVHAYNAPAAYAIAVTTVANRYARLSEGVS